MTANNFAPSMKRLLVHEGGYANHPADPGGRTLEGVTQRVYNAHLAATGRPARTITPSLRKEPDWQRDRDTIYRKNYWNAIRGDELPVGVDYAVFDGAVNSGPVPAGKWLQRALAAAGVYKGAVDGHIGAATVAAVVAHPDHDKLIAAMLAIRLRFLQGLRTWGTFGPGWSRRLREVQAAGQAWATGSTAPKATPTDKAKDNANGKGREDDTKVTETPEGKSGTEQVTTAGAGGLLATLWSYYEQASSLLTSITGLPEAWSKIILGSIAAALLAVAVVLAVRAVWGLFRLWRDKRKAEAERAEAVDLGPAPEAGELPAFLQRPRRKVWARRATRKRKTATAKRRASR